MEVSVLLISFFSSLFSSWLYFSVFVNLNNKKKRILDKVRDYGNDVIDENPS